MMKNLALIPARGGSKSIPRKNIREVAGKPLIAYSIEQAINSSLITRVVVSTDDEEIAEIAREYGAEVPFLRPSDLAGDMSPDVDVFRHALCWFREHENYEPGLIVHLRPTMPVRRVSIIDRAIQMLMQHPEATSLRAVSIASQSPYKMWHIRKDGYLNPVVQIPQVDEPYNIPRQQLPMVYWQNGYIDIIRPKVILESGSMTGKRIIPFIVQETCVDIDYEESIYQAEKLLKKDSGESGQDIPEGERYPS